MKIAFRVDSSNLIGAGHTRRCVKLADDLRHKTKEIYFITKNLSGNFNKLIDKKKFKKILIKNTTSKNKLMNDWNSTRYICEKFKINILIVDSYELGINWERKIKDHVDKLVVIDDFSKVNHSCDLIINSERKKKRDQISRFTGLEYVITPNQISRTILKKTKKRQKTTIGTFFGSSDNKNVSEKFLKIFSDGRFHNFKFISILGKNNKNATRIKNNFKKYKNLFIKRKFKSMDNFFKKIDILISPGSVTSFEAICRKIKCINVPLNFHQRMSSNFQERYKISNTLRLKNIFNEKGKKLLIRYFKRLPKENKPIGNEIYLDGKSSKRISEILIPSKFNQVSINRAKNVNDCLDLFKLHNEKENIKNSFNQKKEKLENHIKWFKKKKFSKKSHIFIFRVNGLCVGQVRIDIIKKGLGLIDYSLDKIFRGRGWGKLILNQAMKKIIQIKNINEFQAKVKKTNIRSAKIFKNLYFLEKNKKKYFEFNKRVAVR